MLIEGSCHCGNIAFTLTWEPDPAEIVGRTCDCTFCVKHGGVWTSNPKGALRVMLRDPAAVSKYAFATGTAEFHICSRCGIVPVVTSTIDRHVYAVVSVNAFNNVERSIVRRAPVTFEGESMETRLARRTKGWIADVKFEGGKP
jgi:hypothetical protein